LEVTLEAIKFNHNPNSATTDAFNIRKNETEPVIIPEWRRGISVNPEDSPAAYARDAISGCITIKAKFSCTDPNVSNIKVRAIDAQRGNANILGKVQPTRVTLINGESGFVSLTLPSRRFARARVGVYDIVWHWQFSYNSSDWICFATTKHRIFMVLALPTLPWQPDSPDISNTQQPWTDVLHFACRWAGSATSTPQAATLITQQVSGLGVTEQLVHYDNPQSGATGFTLDDPPTFDCTDFLRLIRRQSNQHGSGVNCDDCAAFVATFANILGCSVAEAQMDHNFPLNPHLRIGATGLETDEFSYHTVAWAGACGEDDEVFDACVQLDSDDRPSQEPHPLFVPANVRFGRRNERLYRFRLTSDQDRCNPVQGSALRRRVGFITFASREAAINPIQEAIKQPKQAITIETFSELLKKLNNRKLFAPWVLENLNFILDVESLLFAQSFFRHRKDKNVVIRIDAYASPSVEAARHKLDHLLSRFQLRKIQKKELDFGDIVWTVPKEFVIVFARRQFVFRLRNVGKTLASGESLARAIDSFLTSRRAETF
jgi:hypothetical protein